MSRFSKVLNRKPTISAEEWEKIETEAQGARIILEDERCTFFIKYLENARESIKETMVRQSINDAWVEEHTTENGVLQRVKKVFFPAKKELDKLAGQYIFIEQLISDLKVIASLPEQAKKDQSQGLLEIHESHE